MGLANLHVFHFESKFFEESVFRLTIQAHSNLSLFFYFLVVTHDSKKVCLSVRLSICNVFFFWSAKKGQKWAKMRSVMTRRAEIRRVTTYFVYTNWFFLMRSIETHMKKKGKNEQKWDQWWRGGQRLDQSGSILCIQTCYDSWNNIPN